MLKALLYFVILFHFVVIFTVISSFFVLPFKAPWYIAVPLMIYIFYLVTTRVDCPLTNFENFIRSKLGMRKISGFVGFYMYRPIKKFLRTKR